MSGLPPINIHSDDGLFIEECLQIIPKRLHKGLLAEHFSLYPESRREANLLLLNEADKHKEIAKLQTKYITFSPAKKHASVCADLIEEGGILAGAEYCDFIGIGRPVFPRKAGNPTAKNSQESAVKKMTSVDWWGKRMKTHRARFSEQADRGLGVIYRDGEVYTNNRTVKEFAGKQVDAKAWKEATMLISEDGDEVELSTVAEASVSNPANRFAEYMVRVKGMEAIADRNPVGYELIKALPKRMTYGEGGSRADVALLDAIAGEGDKVLKVAFALTVPSRFHPYKKTKKGFVRNPRYDGSTPKQSQAWLQDTWTRTTREWERKESRIDAYGFKVLEVHHAGTVHNHLAIYVKASHAQRLIELFYEQALRGDEGKEAGAAKRRLNWKIMATSGGMVNYMTKYISKGIHGADFEDLQTGGHAEDSLVRIMAHRSLWGLRQFAFYRSPSVTVWRELRRLRDQEQENPIIEQARQAAINSDWSAYVDVQGGAFLSMRDRPIKTLRELKTDQSGNELVNQYGERVEQIRGIVADGEKVVTRVKEWVLLNTEALKTILEKKYQAMGNDVADLGHGLDAMIEKAKGLKRVHRLADFAGITMFPPLDLYGITSQREKTQQVKEVGFC